MWVFAIFLAVPLVEIALFVTVGAWLTLWPTLAIVLGSGMLGVFILRLQGLRAMSDMRDAMRNMQSPMSPLANNALIMAAGILLILPGFLTDTLGLLLLIPPVRHWMIRRLAGHVRMFSNFNTAPDWGHGPPPGDEDVITDAEYREVDSDRPGLGGNARWSKD